MHEEFVHFDLIDQYISGKLSDNEAKEFENRLNSDVDFKEEFVLLQSMFTGIRSQELESLKTKIQAVEKQVETSGFFLTEEDIQVYILEESDPSKTALIEKRMRSDKSFAEKIAFEKSMIQGIKLAEQEALKNLISTTQKSMEEEGFFAESVVEEEPQHQLKPRGRISRIWRQYRSIAAVLLVAAIGLTWLISRPDYNSIFTSYFAVDTEKIDKLYESVSIEGFAASDLERKESLFEALDLYKRKEFEQAIDAFKTHYSEYTQDVSALFYSGLSYLEIEQYGKARNTFHEVIESDNPEWKPEAEWYLALAGLKLRDYRKDAKNLFQKISIDETNPHQQDAKEILSNL